MAYLPNCFSRSFLVLWAGVAFFCLFASLVQAQEIIVYDSFNRPVKVALPVRRAVFFEAYEFIPALDIWDRVVGISRYAYTNDLLRQVKPDLNRCLSSAGTSWNMNLETLLKQEPDLVLTWAVRREKVEHMEKYNLRVLSLYPERLRDVDDLALLLGRIFDKRGRGEDLLRAMLEIGTIIKRRLPSDEGSIKKVLWLGVRPTSCAGQGGLADDLIRLSGGINAASEIKERYSEVAIEKIISWNPDIIFIWGHAQYGKEDLTKDEKWRSVRAVRDKRIYQLPPWSTCSPRVYLLGLWMAMKINPDSYRGLDFLSVQRNFYARVFKFDGKGIKW